MATIVCRFLLKYVIDLFATKENSRIIKKNLNSPFPSMKKKKKKKLIFSYQAQLKCHELCEREQLISYLGDTRSNSFNVALNVKSKFQNESQTNEVKLKTHREIELPSAHIPSTISSCCSSLVLKSAPSMVMVCVVVCAIMANGIIVWCACGQVECQCQSHSSQHK